MRAYTVNYRKQSLGPVRGQLADVGFWLHDVPRVILLCRLRGHKPVVDGTQPISRVNPNDLGYRWVCCDRCGVRPDPQGSLNPENYRVGQRYRGHFGGRVPVNDIKSLKGHYYGPGPFPEHPSGTLGGQLIIGRQCVNGIGFEVKVGNAGSDHTIAASIRFGWLGALYLHTERHGTWLQRRLNPTGYDSRVIGIELSDGYLSWRLWAKRYESSRDDPWWQQRSINLRVLDKLLGPKRYDYKTIDGSETTVTVRMPHGDDHEVQLTLQRCAYGRRRGRKVMSWSVDWTAPKGIPARPGNRDRIYGSGVEVSDQAVSEGSWIAEAAAAIALEMSRLRTREDGWEPVDATERQR